MFSVTQLLDSAKENAKIESDYRLAKVIGISHNVISGYRMGKSMPNDKILAQLCALSGDDVAVVAAQVQAERSQSPEGKTMWMMIAKRLAGGASTAILAALFALGLIALPAQQARAGEGVTPSQSATDNHIHRIKWTFWPVLLVAMVRLRQYRPLLRFACLLCA